MNPIEPDFIEHSLKNRTFPSGTVIPTKRESFDKGFTSGFFWPDAWAYVPGGPFIFNDRDPRFFPQASASRDAHEAWMKGWWQGQALKKLTKEKKYQFRAWENAPRARDRALKKYPTMNDVVALVNR